MLTFQFFRGPAAPFSRQCITQAACLHPRCCTVTWLCLSSRCPPGLLSPPPTCTGIQSMKLEDLERRLRADMLAEAGAWGGRVLLHREVAAPRRAPTPSPLRPARGGGEEGVDVDAGEDITRAAEDQPLTMQVQAFWESSGDVGDIDQVGRWWEHAVPASACAYTARQRRHLKRGALAEPPPFPFRSCKPRQLPLSSPSSSSGLCCVRRRACAPRARCLWPSPPRATRSATGGCPCLGSAPPRPRTWTTCWRRWAATRRARRWVGGAPARRSRLWGVVDTLAAHGCTPFKP